MHIVYAKLIKKKNSCNQDFTIAFVIFSAIIITDFVVLICKYLQDLYDSQCDTKSQIVHKNVI